MYQDFCICPRLMLSIQAAGCGMPIATSRWTMSGCVAAMALHTPRNAQAMHPAVIKHAARCGIPIATSRCTISGWVAAMPPAHTPAMLRRCWVQHRGQHELHI